ncbi:MAG: ATP-binding protein [Anaerolineae bacterium]|nr:cell wall metabolism sensor histidine kinase WalK [Thermoflexales bacterium]MDW8407338.1 ATP-binding protein [Anaerolineae bacterium]
MEWMWLIIAGLIALCVVAALRIRALSAEVISAGAEAREAREERIRLQAELAHALAARDAIANTTIDPILFVNAEHIVTYHNEPAKRLFGASCTVGRSLIEITRSYELDTIAEEALNNTYELPRELSLGGRQFRVRAGVLCTNQAAHKLKEETGQKTEREIVLLLYDIGELQRLGRARRDFVANISHELRTPLTTIRLLVDTLRSMPSDEAGRTRLLDQISEQVDSLTQLAQEMYDLSLIESGRVPMRMVSTNVAELVDSVIARLTPQAERAGLTLNNHVQPDVTALIDAEQIRRVLSNLLHNAIKFTPRGGVTVFVSDKRPPAPSLPGEHEEGGNDAAYITLAVQDTGVGIPADALPRIFERFYKVDRVRGQGGTGLGLSIARHIVEAHGGRIWAESQEGAGATFYFTVPADE